MEEERTVWSYCQGFAKMTRFVNSFRSSRLPANGEATMGKASNPIMDDPLPQVGNRPELALKLHTPQKWAGILTLPPISVPISILLPPHATSAPPPPVEAPAVWLELYGLVVRPKISETVSMASRPVGTAVFTWIKAPASWSRRTIDDEVDMGRPTLRE